jgi:tetratricopeptide (TPR) repeat protein
MWRAACIFWIVFFPFSLFAQPPAQEDVTAQSLEQTALATWRDYDYATAERLYRQSLAKDPSFGDAHAGLIRSLLDEKQPAAAQQAANAALQAAPQSAAVQAADGDLLLRQGNVEDAEAAYRRAVAIDDHLARGWFGLGRVAQINSYYRTAKHSILKAHDLDPLDPEINEFWASLLPRAERRKAVEHMVDHPGHMTPERLNVLQSRLAWLIVLGNSTAWKLVSTTETAKLKLDHIFTSAHMDDNMGRIGAPPRVAAVAVHVQLNNKKTVSLLLDTGANGIVLHRNPAEKAGIKPVFDIAAKGIGDDKAASGYLGWANDVKIGPIEFQNVPVTVLSSSFAEGTDGLIGIDVFEHFLISLDIKNSELDLDPLPVLPAENRDDDGTSDRYVAPEMKDYYPVLHMGPHILVSTSIDRKTPGLFFLDTGAFDSQVDSDYVSKDKLKPAPGLVVRGLSGRVAEVYFAENVRIQFGRFVQENFRMVAISMDKLSEGEGIGLTGILGFPLLSQFRISIDYRDGLVNFDYHEKR